MKFSTNSVQGSAVVELSPHVDERGLFARLSCKDEFEAHGLPGTFVQSNLSVTKQRGTIRGMHFQVLPSREGKLVRCMRGAIYDVIIDLRDRSPTFMQHFGVELNDTTRKALFVPHGCAHGFQTLTHDTEVFYEMSDVYQPDLGMGVRWNDPAFGIEWPIEDPSLIDRDRDYPDFSTEISALLSEPDD